MDGKAGKRSGRKSQLIKGRFCRLFWVLIGDGVPQRFSTSCSWDLRRNRSKTSTRTSSLCDLLEGVIGVHIMVLGLMVSVSDVVVVFWVTCNRFLLLGCWHRNTRIPYTLKPIWWAESFFIVLNVDGHNKRSPADDPCERTCLLLVCLCAVNNLSQV